MTLQWVALGLTIVAIVGALVIFGRDWGTGVNPGGGHGAPAVELIEQSPVLASGAA